MKKILLLILVLFLFFTCYLIYEKTEINDSYYVVIGDKIGTNISISGKENKFFINNDMRIIDLINVIKFNQEKEFDGKLVSIHQQLYEADVLIISIGMNDLIYILNENTKNIYVYLNKMINNLEALFNLIDNYSYDKVIVMGFYNNTIFSNEVFDYLNFRVNKLVNKKNFIFIDMNEIVGNNDIFFEKIDNFILNKDAYDKINKIIVEKL